MCSKRLRYLHVSLIEGCYLSLDKLGDVIMHDTFQVWKQFNHLFIVFCISWYCCNVARRFGTQNPLFVRVEIDTYSYLNYIWSSPRKSRTLRLATTTMSRLFCNNKHSAKLVSGSIDECYTWKPFLDLIFRANPNMCSNNGYLSATWERMKLTRPVEVLTNANLLFGVDVRRLCLTARLSSRYVL